MNAKCGKRGAKSTHRSTSLTSTVALCAALGHVSNSSSNPAYLCVHCGDDVPKVRGVSMRNAAMSPLCLGGGIKITSGVYLVADPPSRP